ncbi:MAG TPA: DEAD/DEAH box helicase, partial [Woeseiaceae bacterium]|nr:DEAD/DEAH box helicase [Woeseiaceae bacterium]
MSGPPRRGGRRQREAEARRAHQPHLEFPEALPISGLAAEIAAAVREHPVVVVCGETGSGKTTQLPKICLQLGRGIDGMIGHTQPRRLAARSVAARIAEETRLSLGAGIGYQVRFDDRSEPGTRVKLMTDGILLNELGFDQELRRYDTLIIDEAHERSLNIDFILGYLKRLLPRRPDLKVIITSATIDPGRFSRHFDAAPVIEVSGRGYPVEVRYEAPAGDTELADALTEAARQLMRELPEGDILAFLPGEREIREAAEALERARLGSRRSDSGWEILPLYGRLSETSQGRVFRPGRRRRIVLATNVAETSLTVPRIMAVIDSGVARISRYSYRS